MGKGIRIRIRKATAQDDPGVSKFFGDPTVPARWKDRFYEDVIFFAQIRLADIAPFDRENRLPHTGYLYFFIDTELYPYFPMCDYWPEEPEMLVEDFNALEPEFSHLTQSWVMEFSEDDGTPDGIRLLGLPATEQEGELLLQFDPLEAPTGFLEEVDGYVYFLFGKNKEDWNQIELVIDRS